VNLKLQYWMFLNRRGEKMVYSLGRLLLRLYIFYLNELQTWLNCFERNYGGFLSKFDGF
jgi:hypothetical protein